MDTCRTSPGGHSHAVKRHQQGTTMLVVARAGKKPITSLLGIERKGRIPYNQPFRKPVTGLAVLAQPKFTSFKWHSNMTRTLKNGFIEVRERVYKGEG